IEYAVAVEVDLNTLVTLVVDTLRATDAELHGLAADGDLTVATRGAVGKKRQLFLGFAGRRNVIDDELHSNGLRFVSGLDDGFEVRRVLTIYQLHLNRRIVAQVAIGIEVRVKRVSGGVASLKGPCAILPAERKVDAKADARTGAVWLLCHGHKCRKVGELGR